MKLSTRTRYGIRALLELAQTKKDGPVQLKLIAQHQDISNKYLEQLMTILKSMGFLRSVRGARGGYLLAKDPKDIKMSDVFIALEGPVLTADCVVDDEECERASECVTRQLWAEIQKAMMKVLEDTTLEDLIKRAEKKRALNYQI